MKTHEGIPQPPSEPAAPKKPGLSRREFFALAAVTLGLTNQELHAESQTSPETVVDSNIEVIAFHAKNQKIEYPSSPKELPKALTQLMQKIGELQSGAGVGVLDRFERKTKTENAQSVEEVRSGHAKREQLKRALWNDLKTILPSLPPYSTEQFQRVMTNDVPRLFAPYGVFVKPCPLFIFDRSDNSITEADLALGFYEVDHVESSNTDRWGKHQREDVVIIKKPADLPGQDLVNKHFAQGVGQTFYQNIIIFNDHVAGQLEIKRKVKTNAPEDQEHVDGMLQVLERTPSAQRTKAALAISCLKMSSYYEGTHLTPAVYITHTVAHESSHLFDQTDPTFLAAHTPRTFKKASEEIAQQANLETHEEIDGLLGELRYSAQKVFTLDTMIARKVLTEVQDYGHDTAARWVYDTLVDLAKENPQRYGFRLNDKSPLIAEQQIILQVPSLVDRPDHVDALAEEIMKHHRKNLNEDFSAPYVESKGFEPKRSATTREIMRRLGAGGLLVGGAWMAFNALSERKRIGEAKLAIEELYRDKPERATEILGRLQLDIKDSAVNDVLRQQGIAKLIKQSKDEPGLLPIIDKLKLLMNEGNANKLQTPPTAVKK